MARPTPPPPAAPAARAAGRTPVVTMARLPGKLLASAVARDAKGRYGLALLVAESDGKPLPRSGSRHQTAADDLDDDPAPGLPRALYFLPSDPAGAGETSGGVERLAGGLPEKIDALATVAGNEEKEGEGEGGAPRGQGAGGGDVLILGEPGALYLVDPWGGEGTDAGAGAASCRKIHAAPGLDLRSLHPDRFDEPSPRLPWVPVAGAGRLQLLIGTGSAAKWRELHPAFTAALPLTTARKSWGIQLSSPPVQLLPLPLQGAAPAAFVPRFAAGPDAQGERRLRTVLLSATAGEAPVEAWSMLPGPAVDTDSSFALWDGRPILAVTSLPHLGVFVERVLQLFPLTRDRSRGGSPPLLVVPTDCHLWQRLKLYFADLGATGHQDLVLMHREGLSGKKLRFQVHTADGQGHLAAQPRASTLDVEAKDWFYGADFTGDGIPDLLVEDATGHLLLYRGVGRTYRVGDKPSWSYDLPRFGAAAAARKVTVTVGTGGTRVESDAGSGSGDADGSQGGADESDENDSARRPSHGGLADLVDLRGDGHRTLYLAFADPGGETRIVTVRPAP